MRCTKLFSYNCLFNFIYCRYLFKCPLQLYSPIHINPSFKSLNLFCNVYDCNTNRNASIFITYTVSRVKGAMNRHVTNNILTLKCSYVCSSFERRGRQYICTASPNDMLEEKVTHLHNVSHRHVGGKGDTRAQRRSPTCWRERRHMCTTSHTDMLEGKATHVHNVAHRHLGGKGDACAQRR